MGKTYVVASVRSAEPGGRSWTVELGEWHGVYWPNGITIGSDPRCKVVLPSPDVAPVAARVQAASNHRLLERLPPGTTLPLPPLGKTAGHYDERDREFRIGPFLVSFEEPYRED